MTADMRHVVRQDETVVAGGPAQETVVTAGPAVVVAGAPGTAAPPLAVVRPIPVTAPAPGNWAVSRNRTEAVVDPAADRAALVGWINGVVWLVAGVLDALIAIRFVLLLVGADAAVGFAKLIYGITAPFVAPFLGLFGRATSYDGAAQAGTVQFEALVAIVVWTLIAWMIVKVAQLMLGTNRNRGTVVTDVDSRTRM